MLWEGAQASPEELAVAASVAASLSQGKGFTHVKVGGTQLTASVARFLALSPKLLTIRAQGSNPKP